MDLPQTISQKGGGVKMKKGWKIFWIVCAVCLGIGFVCCAISFAMGVTVEAIESRFPHGIGWISKGDKDDYDDYDYDDYDYNDYDYDDYDYDDNYDHDGHDGGHHTDTIAPGKQTIIEGSKKMNFAAVSAIDADIWGGGVYIKKAEQGAGEISVETQNIDSKLQLRCYMEGNELVFKTARKVVGVKNGNCGKIYIYVPENTRFTEASLSLVAGYLRIEDIRADELSVDVGAGEGNISYFTAHEADLSCGAGSMTASGNADREIEIECGVGEIVYTAEGRQTDYNYEMECGDGEIICGESTYSGVGVDKEIDNHAAKEMNISCGIGNVAVNFSEM